MSKLDRFIQFLKAYDSRKDKQTILDRLTGIGAIAYATLTAELKEGIGDIVIKGEDKY